MTGTQAPPEAPPSLTIDWQAYAAMLEESDWSDEQKRELVETLWSIVVAFVDLGFGVHPAQQACGQASAEAEFAMRDMLCLPDTAQDQREEPQARGEFRDAGARSQPWE